MTASLVRGLIRRTACALVVATAADTPPMRELRQAAVAARVPLVTSRAGAASLARALAGVQHSDPVALQDYTADTLALSAHTNGRPPRAVRVARRVAKRRRRRMIVLGITDPIGDDNAAAILVDGELVGMIEEERLSRDQARAGHRAAPGDRLVPRPGGLHDRRRRRDRDRPRRARQVFRQASAGILANNLRRRPAWRSVREEARSYGLHKHQVSLLERRARACRLRGERFARACGSATISRMLRRRSTCRTSSRRT